MSAVLGLMMLIHSCGHKRRPLLLPAAACGPVSARLLSIVGSLQQQQVEACLCSTLH